MPGEAAVEALFELVFGLLFEAVESGARAVDRLDEYEGLHPDQRRTCMNALIAVAAHDGRLDEGELRILRSTAALVHTTEPADAVEARAVAMAKKAVTLEELLGIFRAFPALIPSLKVRRHMLECASAVLSAGDASGRGIVPQLGEALGLEADDVERALEATVVFVGGPAPRT